MILIVFTFLTIDILLGFINNIDDTRFADSIIYANINFKNITYSIILPLEIAKNLLYNVLETRILNTFIDCDIVQNIYRDIYDNFQRYSIKSDNLYILLDVRNVLIRHNLIPLNDNIILRKVNSRIVCTYTFNLDIFVSKEFLSILLNHYIH